MNWLWLCSLPGIYRKQTGQLLEYYQTPEAIRYAPQKELEQMAFLSDKQKHAILKAQKNMNPEELAYKIERTGIKFISCCENGYPRLLKQISDYPYGLFYKGTLPQEEEHCLGIVGARMCSNYGRKMAAELSEALSDHNISIVSGMAYGIDGNAQAACVSKKGKSYAILGSGVDICYPKEHRELYESIQEHGAVISEYPPGTPVLPMHFPLRNRIISGLSREIIVVEAKKKSGSLITADCALEQGRDIYAVPGRTEDALSEGCNELIAQGAGIITGTEALLQTLGLSTGKSKKREKKNILLATAENMVYICVDSRPRTVQQIARETNLPASEVMSVLGSLVMKGLVQENSGYYSK
ncbi:MAG: DNA-processing protein DprA [Muricoprocola sp.]